MYMHVEGEMASLSSGYVIRGQGPVCNRGYLRSSRSFV